MLMHPNAILYRRSKASRRVAKYNNKFKIMNYCYVLSFRCVCCIHFQFEMKYEKNLCVSNLRPRFEFQFAYTHRGESFCFCKQL